MSSQTINTKRWFSKEWLLEQKSLIALLVLIAVVSSLSPNFFTLNNMFNILQQTSVNAIMAVGMTLVILTSGIDLSVGSLLALLRPQLSGWKLMRWLPWAPRWHWGRLSAVSLG